MTLPVIHRQPINAASFLTFDGFYTSDRYYRGQNLLTVTHATPSITVYWTDMSTGGGQPKLRPGTYRLYFSGHSLPEREVGSVTLAEYDTNNREAIPIDHSLIADLDMNWAQIRVAGPLESIKWFVFVNLDDKPITEQPALIPVVGTSHAMANASSGRYRWAWIPRERIGKHKPVPLAPREAAPFSDTPGYGSLHRTNLVVPRTEDNHRFNVTRNGLVTTFNKQNYFWSDLIAQYPRPNQVDGPRGVGTINFPTHIEPNRKGGAHICNPWRFVRMLPDGSLTTLVGWVHEPLPAYHGHADIGQAHPSLKLRGDWSQVKGPLGFWETWGFCWRSSSLATDETAAKIGPPANLVGFEHPHYGPGPQGFLADARHGRILKFQFPHNDHKEPVVTEFITGLNDPWDIRYRKSTDTIIVSERQSHRIVEYSAETGAFVRVIVQGAPLARVVLPSRFVSQLVSTDTIRREPVVLPEGIAILEGEDEWLYYGSVAMREVRRVNLVTGEIQHVAYPIYTNGQSHFYKIAVSDGSFGPRGTCFVTSWTISRHGFPEAFRPDGTQWAVHYYGAPLEGWPNITSTLGYGCAVGVGRAANGEAGGRLFVGGSREGIAMITRALPTDTKVELARYDSGRKQFLSRDLDLLFADSCSLFGYEPPWGEHADLDYYLEQLGYLKAEQPVPEPEPEPEPEPTVEQKLADALAELAAARERVSVLESDLEATERDLSIAREELSAAATTAQAVDQLVRAARSALEQADAMVQ